MTRLAFTLASALSLLLCGGACVLWARSYRPVGPSEADSVDFTHADPLYWAISNPGQLTLCRQVGKDWNSPTPKFRLLGIEYASSRVGASSLRNLFVPYWMLALVTIVPPLARLAAWRRSRVARGRGQSGHCPACNYDLRASTGRCPECGRTIAQASQAGR